MPLDGLARSIDSIPFVCVAAMLWASAAGAANRKVADQAHR
jgi:hypothetical protein